MDDPQRNARKIQESIRLVLLRDWDPIGVQDVPEAQDEYDSYVGGVYRLLASGATAQEIAEHLLRIEMFQMGLGTSNSASLLAVAEKLRALQVKL